MALTKIDDRGLKTPIDLIDNEKIRFGTGNDLEIYHTGVYSLIANTTGDLVIRNTGDTYLQSDSNIIIGDVGNNEKFIKCVDDGAVELYYDNTKTFETISGGVTVTGTGYVSGGWRPLTDNAVSLGSGSYRWYDLNISNDIKISDGGKIQLGAGPDLEIYSDGTNSFVKCPDTGNNLTIESDQHLYIKVGDSEDAIKCVNGQAVELYYDNAKKLETRSDGVGITGILNMSSHIYLGDNDYLILGASNDIQLYHDTADSYFVNGTGNLRIYSGGAESIRCGSNDAVELYYNGTKRFETHATGGNFYPGSDSTSVRIYGSNNSTVAATIGSTNSDEGFFRAYDGGTMKTWVEARGIAFNGDTSDVNFLDDYEEGSWTPAYENATSYATQIGHYTKIGRMVYAYFSINPYATSSSHAFINNLPFVVANESGSGGGVAKGYQNYDIENGPIYYIEPNSTRIYFYKDNGSNFSAADGNGFNFRGVAIYHV